MSIAAPRWQAGVYNLSRSAPRHWIGGHIRALDGIRGAAVLAVMLHHFFRAAPILSGAGGAIQRATLIGWRGVDLFFVLSGFLITGVLLDAKGSAGYFKTFYTRRALRIFPLYYGVLLLILLASHFDSLHSLFQLGNIHASLGWLFFYGNNIAIAGHRDLEIFGSLGHFWSLAVEEHFYLVWPAVVFFCTRRQVIKIALGCIALAVVLRISLAVLTHSWVPSYVLTPCRIDGLALGAILAVGVRSELPVRIIRRWAWEAMAMALIIVLVAGFCEHRFANQPTVRRVFEAVQPSGWSLLFVAVLAILLSSRPRELPRLGMELWPMVSLGRYSYAIYVLHLIFLPIFVRCFGPQKLAELMHSPTAGVFLFCGLCVIASYCLGWISWQLFEKRFLKLKELMPYRTAAPRTARPIAASDVIYSIPLPLRASGSPM